MRRGFKKRGLSPIVASALLILLVIVLAVIIFLWARGFIQEKVEKFGKPIEQACSHVKFDVSRQASELDVVNRGNINIKELDVKFIKGGDSEMKQFAVQVDALKSAIVHVTFKMKDGEEPNKIIVYPALVGSSGNGKNGLFTCMNSGVTVN